MTNKKERLFDFQEDWEMKNISTSHGCSFPFKSDRGNFNKDSQLY